MRIGNRKEGIKRATADGQRGQTLVEYGLLLLLIAVVVVVMIKALGGTTSNTYNSIANSVLSAAK
ncbi:MAG TPA: hypothetical protein VL949_04455 [Geobacteraceae bacterium]|nr:hypothetical protein [Geobacteraceae bacterium]